MREKLLDAVRGGESIAGAARRLGIPRQTIYGWRERDAAFREALTAALSAANARSSISRRPTLVAVESTVTAPLPDRDELLRRLDEQSRAGNVRATVVLLREVAGQPPSAGRATADRLLGLVP